MEPEQLIRGRVFQTEVQADYKKNTKGGGFGKEKEMLYKNEKGRIKGNIGRMDIVIDDTDNNFIMIMEIKATDWDKIKPKNIIRNLYRHGRQLHKYIDKFINVNNYDVGLAVIYPEPPLKEGLREYIEEQAMIRYSFPVYWYSEIKT